MRHRIWVMGWLFGLLAGWAGTPSALASGQDLRIATQTKVNAEGQVHIRLTLENTGDKPLFQVVPMFHFHHTMARTSPIERLAPGATRVLENHQHPPVMREGNYPLVVMARYNKRPDQKAPSTQIHTDSFFFREPVKSEVGGRIQTQVQDNHSVVRVLLENRSESLKNVRLMLLLPPGLDAEGFQGMKGFTLRGGDRKLFEFPVKREISTSSVGSYPVHLMIEYGEMLKHYTHQIRGEIQFATASNPRHLPFHWAGIVVIALSLALIYWFKIRKSPAHS